MDQCISKKYKNTENAKLVICNTDEGKLCLYSPVFDDEKFIAIEPTDINDNIFIKELISNSKVVFNTKNFYIYEKKNKLSYFFILLKKNS